MLKARGRRMTVEFDIKGPEFCEAGAVLRRRLFIRLFNKPRSKTPR
jgi:hypothetical protein